MLLQHCVALFLRSFIWSICSCWMEVLLCHYLPNNSGWAIHMVLTTILFNCWSQKWVQCTLKMFCSSPWMRIGIVPARVWEPPKPPPPPITWSKLVNPDHDSLGKSVMTKPGCVEWMCTRLKELGGKKKYTKKSPPQYCQVGCPAFMSWHRVHSDSFLNFYRALVTSLE